MNDSLRATIEKILWKAYKPNVAPNMEEVTEEILAAVREDLEIIAKMPGVHLALHDYISALSAIDRKI